MESRGMGCILTMMPTSLPVNFLNIEHNTWLYKYFFLTYVFVKQDCRGWVKNQFRYSNCTTSAQPAQILFFCLLPTTLCTNSLNCGTNYLCIFFFTWLHLQNVTIDNYIKYNTQTLSNGTSFNPTAQSSSSSCHCPRCLLPSRLPPQLVPVLY